MSRASIIIPTYNMANYLPFALKSAVGQDHPDLEILVIDDGSTDDTADVVRRYLPRVRYCHQENQGLAAAMNSGVELATGAYLQFLDADDILCANACSLKAEVLDANPGVALVYGQAYVIDSRGQACGYRRSPWSAREVTISPSALAFRRLLRGCHICKSTAMVRRAPLEAVGPFRTESMPGEDWDMWLRVTAHHDLAYIPRPLAYYRVHDQSITAGYTVETMERSHCHTLEQLFSQPDMPYQEMEGVAYAYLDRTLAEQAARLRQRRVFARHLLRAWRREPRLLAEARTWGALYEGAKTLLPFPLLQVGRRVKLGIARRRGGLAAAHSVGEP